MVTPSPYYTFPDSDLFKDLSPETAISILKDSEKVDKTVCHLPPVNPNGGEVYLFVPRDIAGKGKPDVAISEVFILSCYS